MRDMSSHAEKMRILTDDRDNRASKYDIWHTDIECVVAELGKRNLSIDGTIERIREMLLRAMLRYKPKFVQTVPWYEQDEWAFVEREFESLNCHEPRPSNIPVTSNMRAPLAPEIVPVSSALVQSVHSRVSDDLIDLTEDREVCMRENVLHDGANEDGVRVNDGSNDGDGIANELNNVNVRMSADVHPIPLTRETSPLQLRTQASAVGCKLATMSAATAVTMTASTLMLTTSRPSENWLRMSTTAYAYFATRVPSAPRLRRCVSTASRRHRRDAAAHRCTAGLGPRARAVRVL